MPREQPIDRLADTRLDSAVERKMGATGEIVDVEQRQRPARNLLRAPERIAIERRQQRRRVERVGDADRERDACAPRHEVGEQIAGEREAFALGERLDRAARKNLRRRPHRQFVTAFEDKSARPADAHGHRGAAGAARRQRHRGGAALFGIELESLRRHAADDVDAFAPHLQSIVAGLPCDVVDLEMHGAAIAVEKKARQRRGEHHRVPYGDVTGGAADLVLRPRDRHHPRRAGKIRDVEHDLGGAIGLDGDDTGIERQGLLRGRRALQLDRGIAAGLDLPARTLHAVDELTVEVADLGGEPALAEIIIVGRRRLVAGQVENADVDRGDDDVRLLAGVESLDFGRDAQRAIGTQQRRQAHVERKRARFAVDREPLHADGAAGHALGAAVERAPQRCHHIGAAAPVVADRDAQLRGARGHVLRDRGDQPVADHVERNLAGGARGHGDRHAFAGHVFRLVERDFEQIRRVGARLRVPAGIEADRSQRPAAIAGRHF